jgi:hypothetical protein
MRGFCDRCGNPTNLEAIENQGPPSERGIWLRYRCDCGYAAFAREGDVKIVKFDAWAKTAEAKRKKNGDEKEANPRAHWLN